MPATMIHLLTARKLRPNAGGVFLLGNVAPDAVSEWHAKDATHFRDVPDRLPPLTELACKTSGDFAEGILLHLYVDWKWDTTLRDRFIEKTGEPWFRRYRDEIAFASSFLHHNTEWAAELWAAMSAVELSDYGETPGTCAENVKTYVSSSYTWHCSNVFGPSPEFTPSQIEEFASEIADTYNAWRVSVN